MKFTAIEQLEARIAPAIALSFADGVLQITGELDKIRLDIDHSPGNTVVKDFYETLGAFAGVTDIVVKLGGEGLVEADFAPAMLGGNFSFKSSGKLNLEFTANSKIGGNVKVIGNLTDETVLFHQGMDVSGNVTIRTGGGSDTVGLSLGGTFRGNVFVDMGNGDNSFGFQGGTIAKNLSVIQGNGWDRFSYGIAGAVSVGGSVFVSQGGGSDRMQTSGGGLTVGGDFIYRGGPGNDVLLVNPTVLGGKVSISMGGGNDTASVDGSAVNAAIKIKMGGGNDSLAGSMWTFMAPVRVNFDGGRGIDSLAEPIASILGSPKVIQNFENVM